MQSFKKYMIYKKDFNAIILHLLRGLVKDALQFEKIISGATANLNYIEVKVDELQSKVIVHLRFWNWIFIGYLPTLPIIANELPILKPSQALDYGMTDLRAFFTSNEFASANFELDEVRSVIRHRLAPEMTAEVWCLNMVIGWAPNIWKSVITSVGFHKECVLWFLL